ncbi:MAG: P-loop NTPase [Thermodesulfobacteriota bacterium]|nr:P-loop NTPase [Thermodesulfobacteriota bacterium]
MAHICAIGGGKGGSGKTFICANLGFILATHGKKVILIDLDLGASNLHTLVAQHHPKTGLHHFLNKSVKDLSLTAEATDVRCLFLITSLRCSLDAGNLFYAQKQKIIRAIGQLPADFVLLDIGAGTTYNTLDFFLAADQGLFILTPEPTSIQNTVQFIKAIYLRKLKLILKQDAFTILAKEVANESNDGVVMSPLDIVDRVMKREPERAKYLEGELNKLTFRLILNQHRSHIDTHLGQKIEKVCNRHFYSQFKFLGNIAHNERVSDSIIAKKIFVLKYPYTATTTDLKSLANRIVATRIEQPAIREEYAYV